MKPNQLMSAKERSLLAMLAGQAYDVQTAAGLTDGLKRDDWRRAECLRVTGRTLSNGLAVDVGVLKAHFKSLGARVKDSPRRPWLTGEAHKRAQMLYRLDESLAKCGKSRAYALEAAKPMVKDYTITLETMALDDLRKLIMEFATRAKSAMKAGTVGGDVGEPF